MATKAKTWKGATGALLAGAMLAGSVPASAQVRYDDYRRDRGIGVGEIIAGAVVLGGLAAILGGTGNRNRTYGYGYDERYGNGYGYDNGRQAVEQCVYAVEQQGYRGQRLDVTQIRDIDRINGGFRVQGDVRTDTRYGYGYGQGYDPRYGQNYDPRYGNRGYYDNSYNRGRYDDNGRFSCTVRYGRVEDVRLRGF